MARQRAKIIPDTNGRQARSLTPANAPKEDSKDRLTLSHETGNRVAATETRTHIEKLAYELYLQRGRQDGYDEQDWLEAERLALAQPTTVGKSGSDRLSTSSTRNR